MRRMATVLALFLLALAMGCSRYVQVTVYSDPYGASLNSGSTSYGQCPCTMHWELTGEDMSQRKMTVPDITAQWPSGATKSSGPVVLKLRSLHPKNRTLYALRAFLVGEQADTLDYTITRDYKGDSDAQALQYDQQMGEQLRNQRIQAALTYLQAYLLLHQQQQNATTSQELRRNCMVSYWTANGWSQESLMEVEFATGEQLSRRMPGRYFGGGSAYALLWFGRGEVAIVKSDRSFFGLSSTFGEEEFKSLFFLNSSLEFTQVNGDGQRKWRIRAKDSIFFIDPRSQ